MIAYFQGRHFISSKSTKFEDGQFPWFSWGYSFFLTYLYMDNIELWGPRNQKRASLLSLSQFASALRLFFLSSHSPQSCEMSHKYIQWNWFACALQAKAGVNVLVILKFLPSASDWLQFSTFLLSYNPFFNFYLLFLHFSQATWPQLLICHIARNSTQWASFTLLIELFKL